VVKPVATSIQSIGPEDPGSADADIHGELYCLRCGYCLTGLPGDAPRCPECGMINPLDDARVEYAVIVQMEKRLQRLVAWSERGAVLCLFCTTIEFVSHGAGCVFMILPAGAWAIATGAITQSADDAKATGVASRLIQLQTCLLGLIALLIAQTVIWIRLASRHTWLRAEGTIEVLSLATSLVLLAGGVLLYRRLHRQLRAALRPCAQNMARMAHSRRLRTPPAERGFRGRSWP